MSETMAAALSTAHVGHLEPQTWHALDRIFERVGRDWAIVYRAHHDQPCLGCGRPTSIMVSFSPRAALPICGACRGY